MIDTELQKDIERLKRIENNYLMHKRQLVAAFYARWPWKKPKK